jgi:hypothetical protein
VPFKYVAVREGCYRTLKVRPARLAQTANKIRSIQA